MTKFTKEQRDILIKTAEYMVKRENTSGYSENIRKVAEIALAALTAAPTAYIHKAQGDLYRPEYLSEEDANGKRFDPLYRLPLLEGLK